MADLKLDTLIKVLMMTTSDTDGEALAAMRRANSLLRAANVDWDKLLRGKVTVVADPFSTIDAPQQNSKPHYAPSPPSPPRQPVRPTPPPPPPPSQAARYASAYANAGHANARQNNTNKYSGLCFNCNDHVDIGMGALRDVMGQGTKIFCEDCNMQLSSGRMSIQDVIFRHTQRNKPSQQNYAPRVKRKVTTKDLLSDIFDN
jgi:hypothetical protein